MEKIQKIIKISAIKEDANIAKFEKKGGRKFSFTF